MATIVTRAGKGTPLTNTEVDANFTNLNTDKAELSGATFTGDVKLGDNDKATFGASDDLQIYHDGFNTYLKESGAGSLLIDATNTYFRNAAGTKDYAWMVDGGAVSLFHNNAVKLATTATGIDVTGNTVSDSFSANGSLSGLNAGSVMLDYNGSSVSRLLAVGADANTAGTLKIVSTASDGGPYIEALTVSSTGIDVTGTATMDGLSVLGTTENKLSVGYSAALSYNIYRSNDGYGALVFDATQPTYNGYTFKAPEGNRLKIAGNGDISFYEDTGTTPKMVWSASAEGLAIGHSAPDGALDIEKTVNIAWSSALRANHFLQISNVSTTGGSYSGIELIATGVGAAGAAEIVCIDSGSGSGDLAFSTRNSSVWSEKMRISSAGLVGIGTSSPTYKLSIGGAYQSVNTDLISITDTATVYRGTPNGAGFEHAKILSGRDASTFTYGSFLSFYTEGKNSGTTDTSTERMRIDSAGNLLVGTTSTDYNSNVGFQVKPSGQVFVTASSTNPALFNRKTTDGEIAVFRKDGTTVGSIGTEGGDLTIGNADTGLQFVNTSQIIRPQNLTTNAAVDAQVSLGQSAYRFKDLWITRTHIANSGSSYWTLDRNDGDGSLTFADTGSERMRISSAGDLLVGKTTAGAVLTHGVELSAGGAVFSTTSNAGDSSYFVNLAATGTRYLQRFYAATTFVGSITSTGTATAYNTSSDYRLKENISDADDAGSKIDAIQVRQYDWKAGGSHQDYGMIAQELLEVAPEAVSGDADSEDMMGVDYSKLVPMLIKEIQSLRNRVAQLETGE